MAPPSRQPRQMAPPPRQPRATNAVERKEARSGACAPEATSCNQDAVESERESRHDRKCHELEARLEERLEAFAQSVLTEVRTRHADDTHAIGRAGRHLRIRTPEYPKTEA